MNNKYDILKSNSDKPRWPNEKMYSSSIVGCIETTRVKLWFRLKSLNTYTLYILNKKLETYVSSEDKIDEESIVKKIFINPKEDKNTHIESDKGFTITKVVSELTEDKRYFFAVFNNHDSTWELGYKSIHTFKTLPNLQKNDSKDICFGMYSCHMPYKDNKIINLEMWEKLENKLKENNARFVIGGGDQVYVDGTENKNIWKWLGKVKDDEISKKDMVHWYREIYRRFWAMPEIRAVHRQFPNYMTWDDHEIMDGWGSYTDDDLKETLEKKFTSKEEEENEKSWSFEKKNPTNHSQNLRVANEMFKAAKKVYKEYQHSHNVIENETRLDYDFNNCGADFFIFDMRGSRDFTDKTKFYKVLGKEQFFRFKNWLENLESSDTPIFIVSTVPMVHLRDYVSNILDWTNLFGSRDDVIDHWAYKEHDKEFQELLKLIFKTSDRLKRPVVVLSGDVHIGTAFKLFTDKNKHYPNAKVFQVTSSPITYAGLSGIEQWLMSLAVSSEGVLSSYRKKSGKKVEIKYKNYFTIRENNFATIRFKTDGEKTTKIVVEFQGSSTYRKIDLLTL